MSNVYQPEDDLVYYNVQGDSRTSNNMEEGRYLYVREGFKIQSLNSNH